MRKLLFIIFLSISFAVEAQMKFLGIYEFDIASNNIERDTTLKWYAERDTSSGFHQRDTFFVSAVIYSYSADKRLRKVEKTITTNTPQLAIFAAERYVFYYKDDLVFKAEHYPPRMLKSSLSKYYNVRGNVVVAGDDVLQLKGTIFTDALRALQRFKALANQ